MRIDVGSFFYLVLIVSCNSFSKHGITTVFFKYITIFFPFALSNLFIFMHEVNKSAMQISFQALSPFMVLNVNFSRVLHRKNVALKKKKEVHKRIPSVTLENIH